MGSSQWQPVKLDERHIYNHFLCVRVQRPVFKSGTQHRFLATIWRCRLNPRQLIIVLVFCQGDVYKVCVCVCVENSQTKLHENQYN